MTSLVPGRRRLLRIGAATLVSAAPVLRAAAAASRDAITIANATGNLTSIMQEMMRQQKFLEGFDLSPKVIEIADGTRILAGVVSGDADCSTMSGFGQVFPAVARGAQLKVLGGGILPAALAVYSAKPDIHSAADLRGRTIGVGSTGALLHQLMVALLVKKGVDLQSVRFVNVGSSADVFRSVAAGVIDAGPGDIALLDNPAQYHVHGLTDGNLSVELPEFTFQGAWASDHMIKSRRDVLVRCLAAYAKLYRFVQTPDAHDAFMAAWKVVGNGHQPERGEAIWRYVQTYKPFAVDLALTPARIAYMQQLNVRVNVQKAVLPFPRVADMSLAADALKRL